MNIEQQVCTLKQAKKLKDLGVSGNSAFRWNQNLYQNVGDINEGVWSIWYNPMPIISDNQLPAFSVAELGVMLPDYYESHKAGNGWCWYSGPLEIDDQFETGDTEAAARAALLISLLSNGFISVDDVNNRLKTSTICQS